MPADRHRAVLDHEGFQQGAVDRFRQLDQRPGLVLVGQHHGEFLAGGARQQGPLRQQPGETRGGQLQQPIAGLLAQGIADFLEAVQLQQQAAGGPLLIKHGLGLFGEQFLVGEAGEFVVVRLVEQLDLFLLLVGHIAEHTQHAGRPVVLVEHQLCRATHQGEPPQVPAVGPESHFEMAADRRRQGAAHHLAHAVAVVRVNELPEQTGTGGAALGDAHHADDVW